MMKNILITALSFLSFKLSNTLKLFFQTPNYSEINYQRDHIYITDLEN